MRRRREFRIILGCLIWIGGLSYLFMMGRNLVQSAEGTSTQIANYLTREPILLELKLERSETMRVGDPVFQVDPQGVPELIGRIVQVKSKDCTDKHFVFTDVAFIELDAAVAPIRSADNFTFHTTPNDFGWVIETMLPDSTRQRIQQLVSEAYEENHRAIVAAFEPVIRDTVQDALNVVGEDIRAALKTREAKIDAIGQRYKSEIIDEAIVPLIQKEIWPIVRIRSEPLVKRIGRELWNEVSIWRFTWRAIYDATPMTNSNLTGKEFKRFLDDKASPIIESYVPEIVRLQQEIIAEIAKNPRVEQVVGESLKSVVNDSEVRELIRDIGQEIFLRNQRLRAVIEKHWRSPSAMAALQEANRRLDPTIVEIGVLMFGAIDSEIAPDFSAVLRNRIMRKDSRWLTLVRGTAEQSAPAETPIRVTRGSGHDLYPGRVREALLRRRREQTNQEDNPTPKPPKPDPKDETGGKA